MAAKTPKTTTRRRCAQCQVAYIDGVRCHETGCPDAWQDETRECRECGSDFRPEDCHQIFCDDACGRAYTGQPAEPEDLYMIVRHYLHHGPRAVRRDLTLDEAQAHCADPETSSRTAASPAARRRTARRGPWFDGYTAQAGR